MITWEDVVADRDRYLDYRFRLPDTGLEPKIEELISKHKSGQRHKSCSREQC